ncbi:MAG: hypothetical protein Q7R66_21575 [Undibacterium sp.]|uniref:hypothetical protein n=1 Tax=Undibacterium sp. TaxID=1914977 RepID=UPI00271A31F1|nr:hypothetical protein [Undibacterium sp.]MDO8654768.1 hypothetical protein [Undibacterium sp.]
MKIDTVTNHQFISQRAQTTGQTKGLADGSVSFAAILSTQTTQAAPTSSSPPKDVNQVDFTNMTRQEMHDWMNGQIRSGNMSFADSRPFLGMTFKDSDMATDTTHTNFFEKALQGIELALSHNDQDTAKRLRMAIETMHRYQQQGINGDAHA